VSATVLPYHFRGRLTIEATNKNRIFNVSDAFPLL
jgi:hypothetical protein